MPGEADAPAAPVLQPRPRSSLASTVLAVLAVVAALWWGQRFLIPTVAGVLLSMLLLPLVMRAARLLHSPVLATVLSLLLFLAALGAAAAAFGSQLARVADRVPEMISLAAVSLAQADADGGSHGVLARARKALTELDRAADRWTEAKATVVSSPSTSAARLREAGARPANVVLAAPNPASAPGAFSDGASVALKQTAVGGSGMLLRFASDLAIIVFVAFFVLSGGPSLTRRFLDQWGYHPQARQNAADALRECSRQVVLYAGVLLITNVVIGLVVWGLFALSGLPDAGGWGVAAAVLHVVPYVGMAVLTGLGASEAFLAHGSLASALGMAAALVLVSTLIGTLVTAWLQGRAARMNPAAVFIGLVFWGALWGLWGLFLGPALVVLAKVVADHTRSGRRLALLLQG